MLSGDDRITTASDLLEPFAIDDPDASAEGFDQFVVLQLLGGLRDGCATRAEQVCEQIVGDA